MSADHPEHTMDADEPTSAARIVTAWTPDGTMARKQVRTLEATDVYEAEVITVDRQGREWIVNRDEFNRSRRAIGREAV